MRRLRYRWHRHFSDPVSTTAELPDLYRRAKAEAALRGQKFRELVERSLRLVLEEPREPPQQPRLADLMKPARGIIASNVDDLGSNPRHLEGFGRDRGHR